MVTDRNFHQLFPVPLQTTKNKRSRKRSTGSIIDNMCEVTLNTAKQHHYTQAGCMTSHFLWFIKINVPAVTGCISDLLLHRPHSLHTQGGCVMSYFPGLIHYTHRVGVWCLTSQASFTTHRLDVRCLTSQWSFTTHTGWMCDVLLPRPHSLHIQGGCVMSYFPVIIHYTYRVDVWCLTSQWSFTTHTGWRCDVLLPRPHSLHTGWMCDVLLTRPNALHTQEFCKTFWIHLVLGKWDFLKSTPCKVTGSKTFGIHPVITVTTLCDRSFSPVSPHHSHPQ